MPVRRVAFIAVLATLAVASQSPAQDQFLRLLNNGKPMPALPISGFLNQVDKAVGTTDSDGDIVVSADALDFAEGDRVAVWVVECADGRVTQVILAREEDGDPCAQEGARPGERCRCRRIAVAFIWGEGPVTIDIGTSQIGRTRLEGIRPSVTKVGLGAGSSFWQNLEDQVCDQEGLTECEVESTAVTVQVFAAFRPAALRGFGFGGDLTYTPFGDFTQTFDGEETSEIDLSVLTLGGFLDYGIPVGQRIWLVPMFGLAWVYNQADVTTGSQSDDRSESGGRAFGKLALDIPFGASGYGLRLEGGHMWGEGDDADTHSFFGLKLFKLFGLDDYWMAE